MTAHREILNLLEFKKNIRSRVFRQVGKQYFFNSASVKYYITNTQYCLQCSAMYKDSYPD